MYIWLKVNLNQKCRQQIISRLYKLYIVEKVRIMAMRDPVLQRDGHLISVASAVPMGFRAVRCCRLYIVMRLTLNEFAMTQVGLQNSIRFLSVVSDNYVSK